MALAPESTRIGPTNPVSEPWLVALDIDGTIIDFDATMTPAVKDAVRDVRDAGHEVILASGRSVLAMMPIVRRLGLESGWLVASNGAVTAHIDPAADPGYVLDTVITFDPGPVLRLLAAEFPSARFAAEDLGIGFHVTQKYPDGELMGRQILASVEELCGRSITRLIVRGDESPEAFREHVISAGLADVSYFIGHTAWMDVSPPGTSKATALEKLRAHLDAPHQRTLAVGDGDNDTDMIRWAARGVAMGQAPAAVREAADEVTGSVKEDGLVPVLHSLL
ncbi:MAG: Cof-type HAD-IIB family hydrolase [Cellulomonadaceae bacterium]|nr:Cof-type HAD-IIB family hydrolase [Cellulomonadaceae bacterium]